MSEEWRPIAESNGRYEVSDAGRVRSLWAARGRRPAPLLLKPLVDREGYIRFRLIVGDKRKDRMAHILVLRAFVGPRGPGQQTRHLNGDKSDNRVANLAWGTCAENMADKVRHGTVPSGSRNGRAKLDESKVREIRRLHRAGQTQRSLSRNYAVSKTTIRDIVIGKTWRSA